MRAARWIEARPIERAIDTAPASRRSPGSSGLDSSSCPSVEPGRTATSGDGVVRRRTEEHELAVRQPTQERIDVHQAEHAVAHGGEVGDDPVHEFDRRAQVGRERLRAVALEAVDLDLRPRLDDRVGTWLLDDLDQLPLGRAPDVQHRVHEQVRGDAVALEHDAHRVDQERGVVGDEQHDRAIR